MRLPLDRKPIHPGEILSEEFIKPYGLTQTVFAKRLRISRKHLNEILHGKKSVSTDIALRLSRLLKTSPELWLNGQMAWDLWQATHSKKSRLLKTIKPLDIIST